MGEIADCREEDAMHRDFIQIYCELVETRTKLKELLDIYIQWVKHQVVTIRSP